MPIRYRGVLTTGESVAMPGATESRAARIDRLFREHYPTLVSLLVRITSDRAQAEEIAADVFCKLSGRLGGADAEVPWMYRVATNAGLDVVRSRTRRRQLESGERESLVQERSALEEMIRDERRARVRSVLAEMKARDAELLLLRAEDMPYKQIADALGVAAGSIGTLLVRAEAEFERRYQAIEGGTK